MKKLKMIALTVLTVIMLGYAAYCIADDAINHKGYNWQTAQEYRWTVSEGKR